MKHGFECILLRQGKRLVGPTGFQVTCGLGIESRERLNSYFVVKYSGLGNFEVYLTCGSRHWDFQEHGLGFSLAYNKDFLIVWCHGRGHDMTTIKNSVLAYTSPLFIINLPMSSIGPRTNDPSYIASKDHPTCNISLAIKFLIRELLRWLSNQSWWIKGSPGTFRGEWNWKEGATKDNFLALELEAMMMAQKEILQTGGCLWNLCHCGMLLDLCFQLGIMGLRVSDRSCLVWNMWLKGQRGSGNLKGTPHARGM